MKGSRKMLMLFAWFLILPADVYPGQDTLAVLPAGSMQPLVTGNIPTEVQMPMMQFPPLRTMNLPPARSMKFEPVGNMKFVPVAAFVDGSELYRQHCSECHGIQTISDIRGMRFSQFSSATVAKNGNMPKLKKEEVTAIMNVLKQSPAS